MDGGNNVKTWQEERKARHRQGTKELGELIATRHGPLTISIHGNNRGRVEK